MPDIIEELKAFRRKLHSIPDISGDEHETAEQVEKYLKKLAPDELIKGVGGTGIIAIFDSGKPGHNILFRAELDALPIQEINEFEHRSTKAGKGHKCGHDGHMVILSGLAAKLSKQRPEKGKAILLYQPAEENGEGAEAVLADNKFKGIDPDYVVALHNLPGYAQGQIVVREGSFTAAVTSLIFKLNGRTSHAAEPENGINPAMAISEIIAFCLELDYNFPEKDNMRVVTPIHINMGQLAYGTSAGDGEVHFTIRCWDDKNLEKLKKDMMGVAKRAADKYKLKLEIDTTQNFHANQNAPEAVNHVRKAARENGYKLLESPQPFKWGEDFGLFTQKFKGCMFGIGAGPGCPALHNPDYDFPDEIIEHGVNMFHAIIQNIEN